MMILQRAHLRGELTVVTAEEQEFRVDVRQW